jgi:hypothetical protein
MSQQETPDTKPAERNLTKEQQSQEIKRHIEEYLAGGGYIDDREITDRAEKKINYRTQPISRKRQSELEYERRKGKK